MSDEIKKPREFWLNTRLERIYKDSDASCPDDEVHVVEFQALRNVQDAYEARETELLNLVREMREAFEKIEEHNLNIQGDKADVMDRYEGIARAALAKADATLKDWE